MNRSVLAGSAFLIASIAVLALTIWPRSAAPRDTPTSFPTLDIRNTSRPRDESSRPLHPSGSASNLAAHARQEATACIPSDEDMAAFHRSREYFRVALPSYPLDELLGRRDVNPWKVRLSKSQVADLARIKDDLGAKCSLLFNEWHSLAAKAAAPFVERGEWDQEWKIGDKAPPIPALDPDQIEVEQIPSRQGFQGRIILTTAKAPDVALAKRAYFAALDELYEQFTSYLQSAAIQGGQK